LGIRFDAVPVKVQKDQKSDQIYLLPSPDQDFIGKAIFFNHAVEAVGCEKPHESQKMPEDPKNIHYSGQKDNFSFDRLQPGA
jgi:hypothetical protein